MLRVITRLLLLAEVTSTISSSDVSGSITTVNVTPPVSEEAGMPPSKVDADATLIEVAPEVNALVIVVCCDREVYLRIVIYLPIGCSGRGLGTGSSASAILLQDAVCKEQGVA